MNPPAAELVAEAEAELREAAAYYRAQRSGLALRFLAAVERSLVRAAEVPLAGTPLGASIRRQLVIGFPYAVIYRADRTPVRVLAVAHLRRRPGYWHGRR